MVQLLPGLNWIFYDAKHRWLEGQCTERKKVKSSRILDQNVWMSRQKLGTRTLSLTLSLSHSLTFTLSLSHSFTLLFTHDHFRHAEQLLFSCLCSKVSSCQVVRLSNCQVVKLLSCQVVKFDDLWSLGHAEQLLFSCLGSKVSGCWVVGLSRCQVWSLGHAEQLFTQGAQCASYR